MHQPPREEEDQDTKGGLPHAGHKDRLPVERTMHCIVYYNQIESL